MNPAMRPPAAAKRAWPPGWTAETATAPPGKAPHGRQNRIGPGASWGQVDLLGARHLFGHSVESDPVSNRTRCLIGSGAQACAAAAQQVQEERPAQQSRENADGQFRGRGGGSGHVVGRQQQ